MGKIRWSTRPQIRATVSIVEPCLGFALCVDGTFSHAWFREDKKRKFEKLKEKKLKKEMAKKARATVSCKDHNTLTGH